MQILLSAFCVFADSTVVFSSIDDSNLKNSQEERESRMKRLTVTARKNLTLSEGVYP